MVFTAAFFGNQLGDLIAWDKDLLTRGNFDAYQGRDFWGDIYIGF